MPNNNEVQVELTNVLTLESLSSLANAKIEILQESIDSDGKQLNNGMMRIRVPFYVAGSKSKVDGLSKKVFWSEKALDTIIQEGNAQIAARKQPLTVYPRHSHALSGHDLPCGDVLQLERSGRLGMATIEVAPTSIGKDVQILARAEKLNAVSLRSLKGDYVLADGKLDGEAVLVCERVGLAGIDFAPDNPAQETFGIEILNENSAPVIEPEPPVGPVPPVEERSPMADTPPLLTLESLRSGHADLVAEIEKPLKAELEAAKASNLTLTQEVGTLKATKEADELAKWSEDIAVRSKDPKSFREVFKTLCQENNIKSIADAAPHIVPLVLAALPPAGAAPVAVEPAKSTQTMLQELFPSGAATDGAGQTAVGAAPVVPAIVLTQEQAAQRSASTVVGGLVMPDNAGGF